MVIFKDKEKSEMYEFTQFMMMIRGSRNNISLALGRLEKLPMEERLDTKPAEEIEDNVWMMPVWGSCLGTVKDTLRDGYDTLDNIARDNHVTIEYFGEPVVAKTAEHGILTPTSACDEVLNDIPEVWEFTIC